MFRSHRVVVVPVRIALRRPPTALEGYSQVNSVSETFGARPVPRPDQCASALGLPLSASPARATLVSRHHSTRHMPNRAWDIASNNSRGPHRPHSRPRSTSGMHNSGNNYVVRPRPVACASWTWERAQACQSVNGVKYALAEHCDEREHFTRYAGEALLAASLLPAPAPLLRAVADAARNDRGGRIEAT